MKVVTMGFKDKCRAEFNKLLLKKLNSMKNPIINAQIIANLIDGLDLTEQEGFKLISMLSVKCEFHTIIHRTKRVKFIVNEGVKYKKFVLVADSYN